MQRRLLLLLPLHLPAEFIQRLDMPEAFGFLRGLHAGADHVVHHATHVHAGSHGCSERPDPLDRHGGAGVLLLLRQDPDRYGLARRRYLWERPQLLQDKPFALFRGGQNGIYGLLVFQTVFDGGGQAVPFLQKDVGKALHLVAAAPAA